MNVPVVFNTVAEELPKDKTIQELLVQQVQSSIYMEDTIKLLEARGVDTIVEIGPGKVLSGFVKRTAPGITSYPVEDMESLNAVLTALKGE
jgi:[acyl-carrier-protein] S-malonyltransferase